MMPPQLGSLRGSFQQPHPSPIALGKFAAAEFQVYVKKCHKSSPMNYTLMTITSDLKYSNTQFSTHWNG